MALKTKIKKDEGTITELQTEVNALKGSGNRSSIKPSHSASVSSSIPIVSPQKAARNNSMPPQQYDPLDSIFGGTLDTNNVQQSSTEPSTKSNGGHARAVSNDMSSWATF